MPDSQSNTGVNYLGPFSKLNNILFSLFWTSALNQFICFNDVCLLAKGVFAFRIPCYNRANKFYQLFGFRFSPIVIIIFLHPPIDRPIQQYVHSICVSLSHRFSFPFHLFYMSLSLSLPLSLSILYFVSVSPSTPPLSLSLSFRMSAFLSHFTVLPSQLGL